MDKGISILAGRKWFKKRILQICSDEENLGHTLL